MSPERPATTPLRDLPNEPASEVSRTVRSDFKSELSSASLTNAEPHAEAAAPLQLRYLQDLLELGSHNQVEGLINGYVAEVTSLNLVEDAYVLRIVIDDGTATTQATMTNALVVRFIGASAKELGSAESVDRTRLIDGLTARLGRTNGLMTVQLVPDLMGGVPTISLTDVRPHGVQDVKSLLLRTR